MSDDEHDADTNELLRDQDEDDENVEQDDQNTTISMNHLPAILGALGIEKYYMGPGSNPTKLAAIKKSLDPYGDGRIGFQTFHEFMPFVLDEARQDEELDNEEAEENYGQREGGSGDVVVDQGTKDDFLMFTQGEDRPIELRDLQRISQELKDNAPEELLQDMLQLHRKGSGSIGSKISLQDFVYIMKMTKSI